MDTVQRLLFKKHPPWPLTFLIFSCSGQSDEVPVKLLMDIEACEVLEETNDIVATFTDVEGKVISPDTFACPNLYTLSGGPEHEKRELEYLYACNLPEELKIDSLSVIFSGYLFETDELANVYAQSFKLTEIKIR
ncbi:hypothetical protein PY092_16180 [Muricauda sp. 334s03]|uniref:Lipoprotein n=1 Tax=Flagellimonas yonaguniensis TaxID=3031325 RepID=A0ABT5Y3T7_9FLAO|nr:hypothetical protein [[Muricauda] yonaguniensis]MDF0717702.1 hypothetical protein [[Muricauda] yonaguniensis]